MELLPSTSQETGPFSSTFLRETLQGLGISAPPTDLNCHSYGDPALEINMFHSCDGGISWDIYIPTAQF